MVHVKRGEKQTLYAYLLNEGVCTVKEENTGKHEQTKIDNLKVLNSMISMESRGFATKTFVWNHRYYTITNEGCQFLRDQLGVTNANVNPKTHQQKPVEQNAGMNLFNINCFNGIMTYWSNEFYMKKASKRNIYGGKSNFWFPYLC